MKNIIVSGYKGQVQMQDAIDLIISNILLDVDCGNIIECSILYTE